MSLESCAQPWEWGFSSAPTSPGLEYFRAYRFLPYSVGWCHWVVPECLCGHRQKFPGATESKLCHRSRTVLTDFFLAHDVLGKLEGENECWQLTGIGQCLEESREMCVPMDKGTSGGRGEERWLLRSQTGIRSRRWTKATCPTNSSSFLLKIRSKFTHLFSTWVQT